MSLHFLTVTEVSILQNFYVTMTVGGENISVVMQKVIFYLILL